MFVKRLLLILWIIDISKQEYYPFRNVSLSWDARVDDLVGRLTVEEMALQMAYGGDVFSPTPAIDRLGIQPYGWDTECLHGAVGHNATAFPQSIGLAATWRFEYYPFRNVSLFWDARVDDLVGRLTLEEMALQMAYGGDVFKPTPAIPRLGIQPYSWKTNCLHGIMDLNATAFPQCIGQAATWSTDAIFRMAEATSEELRGYFNDDRKKHRYSQGLSCFSPVINIFRDPRWGRNQETYGEDPFLSGMLSQAYVKGLQGDHPRYVRASAGCKHFDAYAGPENIPVQRTSFSANVTMRDWRTTFLPAFRYCVEAGTYSLMCSYNSINGVPSCANKELLTNILRGEWGFKGYVVSDGRAIELIETAHHFFNNSIDTVAGAVNAGVSLELCGVRKTVNFFTQIPDAVKAGKLTEDLVRERVKPLFYTRMRLGEFDPPEMNPYASITTDVIEEKSHRDLAVEAAMQSLVLLKNDGTLPLRKSVYDKIGLVGPMADNPAQLNGDYEARPDPKFVSTPKFALEPLANTLLYASGCKDTACTDYDAHSVKNAVSDVDIVIICIGLGFVLESEGRDREDIELPGKQNQLIQDSIKHSGSAKIILITFNAGPVNITWADSNPRISAIIAAFYPGQATGVALYNVLRSSNNSQFGRMPYTWYHTSDQVPPMVDYTMKGRTYKYIKQEPLYPFGYGLTYTSFEYLELYLNQYVNAGEPISGVITLQNNGPQPADEIIQIYISWNSPSVETPQIQLVNFTRIRIESYFVETFTFFISPQNMAVYTDDKGWVVEAGTVTVYAGGEQPGQAKSGDTGYMKGEFIIKGTKVLGFY